MWSIPEYSAHLFQARVVTNILVRKNLSFSVQHQRVSYFSKRDLKKILENHLTGFVPLVIVNNDLTFFTCS